MKQETSVETKVTISANQHEYDEMVECFSAWIMRVDIDQITDGYYQLTFHRCSDWATFRRKFQPKWEE